MANKIYNVRDEAYKYSIFGKKEHINKEKIMDLIDKYIIDSDELKQLCELLDLDLDITEDMGGGIKKNIKKKGNEIIKAMVFIRNLALKTTKLSKDDVKIKELEMSMKRAQTELQHVLDNVTNTVEYIFMGS